MIERTTAQWKQVTPERQETFGNGCGADWFEKFSITRKLHSFLYGWFHTASCRHHDFGYLKGGTFFDKITCDIKFFKAMLSDSAKQAKNNRLFNAFICYALSVIYFFMVLIGGWFSFHFGDQRTLKEILTIDKAKGL